MVHMEKITYNRPLATRVVFSVGEHIAASNGEEVFTEIASGITFTHALPKCNDYLNSTRIDTGLKDGCFDIDHVMQNLRETASSGGEFANGAAELLHMLETLGPEGFNCA